MNTRTFKVSRRTEHKELASQKATLFELETVLLAFVQMPLGKRLTWVLFGRV